MCVRGILCNCCSLLITRWSCRLANDLRPVYERHRRLVKHKNEGASEGRRRNIEYYNINGNDDNPFTFAMKNDVSSFLFVYFFPHTYYLFDYSISF